jgi:hypothetical protein
MQGMLMLHKTGNVLTIFSPFLITIE